MSQTVKVIFQGLEGGAPDHIASALRGASILDAAHSGGVEIAATCGARGRCRSCRIKVVRGTVPPPTVQDTVQLGSEAVRDGFRLACQTKLVEDSIVMPMPLRSEAGHQILGSGKSASDDSRLVLDSGVEKRLVKAKAPVSEHHQTSDHEEILLAAEGAAAREMPLDVLRKLPAILRSQAGQVTVTKFNGRIIDVEAGDTTQHCYGMSFDIGTTSIVGSLLDLASGEELASVGSMNPQAPFGGDLMSRIAFAQFDDKKLQTLRVKALNAINDFIKEACDKANVSHEHIYKVVLVGNTCMHHILLGIDVSYVGLAPYAPVVRDALVIPARDLPLKVAPRAQVCTLPIVAGFVGADTMACVLATRIYESKEIRALVDIGTNGEVVMGSRDRLVACSAPAGPAFEGAQIRHGMRGAVGAIERVHIDGDVRCTVIGDQPASGICGSGLLDACAKMVDAGVMEASGLFRRKKLDELPAPLSKRLVKNLEGGTEFVLVWAEQAAKPENVTLTQGDVRQLQLAKSAIYSGIAMLQHVMQVSHDQLQELMLCGGFGNYIDIESAVKIRLLPELPVDRITYVGNAAALGAQMALLSETERRRATELANRMEHVALAARPEFQEIFIEGMKFAGRVTHSSDARPASTASTAMVGAAGE
ncbi:MAG: ASKHA domain-containing protein [Hyphomonadaceae bacterium]|nr:ASKHA domain-containing protein [Hyphomonadaceae bacterium]